MSPTTLPFRDINLLVSPSHYAFRSASSSSTPTLIVERPTGDLRLDQASGHGAKRVSSISGILGIIKLKLGKTAFLLDLLSGSEGCITDDRRQVYYCYIEVAAGGKAAGPYGLQSYWDRVPSLARKTPP